MTASIIARPDALITIPVSLGIWAITGLTVVAEGIQLRHAGLTGWGADPGRRIGDRSSRRHGPGRPPRTHGPAAWPTHRPPARQPSRTHRARKTLSGRRTPHAERRT